MLQPCSRARGRRFGAGHADHPDPQPHAVLPVGEDMPGLRPDRRFAPVGPGGPPARGPAPRLPAVDAARRAVRLEPVLVPLGAVGGIAPRPASGVGDIDQALPQPRAVMGGVRRDPAADDPVLPVHADVGLAAEDRDGDVDLLRAVRPELRLAELDDPARVRVLPRRLRGLAGPYLPGRPSRLDRGLLPAALTIRSSSANRASSSPALIRASRKSHSVFASGTLSRSPSPQKRIQPGRSRTAFSVASNDRPWRL